MDEHIHGHIDGVTERCIDTGTALVYVSPTKELEEAVYTDNSRYAERSIEPAVPHVTPFSPMAKHMHCGNKECPEVSDDEPSFHTFKVGPNTAEWIDTYEIGNQCDQGEESDGNSEWSEPWTISRIQKRENEPSCKGNLNQYPEIKCLSRNEWEKEGIGYDKRKDRYKEERPNSNKADNFLEVHNFVFGHY
jgi:hypothetical protein